MYWESNPGSGTTGGYKRSERLKYKVGFDFMKQKVTRYKRTETQNRIQQGKGMS